MDPATVRVNSRLPEQKWQTQGYQSRSGRFKARTSQSAGTRGLPEGWVVRAEKG